jgi:Protein of unknown function (DUF2958)
MALITEAQRTKLTANWTASKAAGRHLDHCPVVRLKSELGQHVLLTEMNPENLDHVFGLVNDYCYTPEISIKLLRFHALVEEYHPLSQDRAFVADKPLSAYREEEEAFWAEQHVLNDRMNADFRQRDKAAAAAGAAAALAAVRSPRRKP